jgi:hypothetical protein
MTSVSCLVAESVVTLLKGSLTLDHLLLLHAFLNQVGDKLVKVSTNELLLSDSAFNAFNSVRQIVRINLMDMVCVFVKHGLYQHYMKGGNCSMIVEYVKRLSPLLPIVDQEIESSIMAKAFDTSLTTYILNFINWAYVKNFSQEVDQNEYQYLEILKKNTTKLKNFFQDKVPAACLAKNTAKTEMILDYVRYVEKEKILEMYRDLIRAHIIIEDKMLNRMIYLKTDCLENIHNVYEDKKYLLKTIVLNTDCSLE